MPTKSTVPTVANGDSWSAAQHNTYLRDNIEALWPYMTAGDMAYATSSNQLTRLAPPGALSVMQHSGTAPSWLTANVAKTVLQSGGGSLAFTHSPSIKGVLHSLGFHQFGDIGQTSTNTSIDTDVTNSSFNITTSETCTIVMIVHALMATGASGYQAKLRGVIGGVADVTGNNYGTSGTTSYSSVAYSFRRTGVAAGTIACSLKFGSSHAGVSAFIERGGILVMAFVE